MYNVQVKILVLFQFLTLDGNSLTTDDLLQLGRNRYKIKVQQETEQEQDKLSIIIYNIIVFCVLKLVIHNAVP